MTQQTKIEILRLAMRMGNWEKALSVAAKFPRLGPQAARIKRAHEALQRPDFQKQLGQDPDALIADGKAALQERYGVQ